MLMPYLWDGYLSSDSLFLNVLKTIFRPTKLSEIVSTDIPSIYKVILVILYLCRHRRSFDSLLDHLKQYLSIADLKMISSLSYMDNGFSSAFIEGSSDIKVKTIIAGLRMNEILSSEISRIITKGKLKGSSYPLVSQMHTNAEVIIFMSIVKDSC